LRFATIGLTYTPCKWLWSRISVPQSYLLIRLWLSFIFMSVSKAQFSLPVRVYYEDTDAGGIVYNANYLKFFERARTEWFRELGVDQFELMQQNIGFVVRRVEMDNRLPARLNQLLIVKCRIAQLKKASMVFEQHIELEQNDSTHTICTASFTVACVDLAKMKPIKLPSYIIEVLDIVT
jgi:acyl-CoA thioester hydrolase